MANYKPKLRLRSGYKMASKYRLASLLLDISDYIRQREDFGIAATEDACGLVVQDLSILRDKIVTALGKPTAEDMDIIHTLAQRDAAL